MAICALSKPWEVSAGAGEAERAVAMNVALAAAVCRNPRRVVAQSLSFAGMFSGFSAEVPCLNDRDRFDFQL
jgi:hypothetical protein